LRAARFLSCDRSPLGQEFGFSAVSEGQEWIFSTSFRGHDFGFEAIFHRQEFGFSAVLKGHESGFAAGFQAQESRSGYGAGVPRHLAILAD